MAVVNRRLFLLSLIKLFVLLRVRRRSKHQQLQKKRTKRRWWVRPMLRDRKQHGQYHVLMKKLETEDREYYFRLVVILKFHPFNVNLD